jgi:hypothetical protein
MSIRKYKLLCLIVVINITPILTSISQTNAEKILESLLLKDSEFSQHNLEQIKEEFVIYKRNYGLDSNYLNSLRFWNDYFKNNFKDAFKTRTIEFEETWEGVIRKERVYTLNPDIINRITSMMIIDEGLYHPPCIIHQSPSEDVQDTSFSLSHVLKSNPEITIADVNYSDFNTGFNILQSLNRKTLFTDITLGNYFEFWKPLTSNSFQAGVNWKTLHWRIFHDGSNFKKSFFSLLFLGGQVGIPINYTAFDNIFDLRWNEGNNEFVLHKFIIPQFEIRISTGIWLVQFPYGGSFKLDGKFESSAFFNYRPTAWLVISTGCNYYNKSIIPSISISLTGSTNSSGEILRKAIIRFK